METAVPELANVADSGEAFAEFHRGRGQRAFRNALGRSEQDRADHDRCRIVRIPPMIPVSTILLVEVGRGGGEGNGHRAVRPSRVPEHL